MLPTNVFPPLNVSPLVHPLERGTRIITKRGEVAHDENDNEVRAEPGDMGVIVGVDRRESGLIYSVSFGDNKPWIMLSPAEVEDTQSYEVRLPPFFSITFNRNGRSYVLRAFYTSRQAALAEIKKTKLPKSADGRVFSLTDYTGAQVEQWLREKLKQPPEVVTEVMTKTWEQILAAIKSMTKPVPLIEEPEVQPYALSLEQLKRMRAAAEGRR